MTYELRKPEQTILECPFCRAKTINATFFPSILQSATSRSAAGSKTKFYQTKEKYEIQSGCPNCKKSQKEIERELKKSGTDVEKEQKIMERLKKEGLFSGEITSKF